MAAQKLPPKLPVGGCSLKGRHLELVMVLPLYPVPGRQDHLLLSVIANSS